VKEASASFLKKRSKKLLIFSRVFAMAWPRTAVTFAAASAGANARDEQKFFASFFQKRSACLLA
jgi:hypothetical protein